MAGRLNNVYSLPSNSYSEECPVVISAGALYTDTDSGKVLAQLKLRNISSKQITSCKVSIKSYESNGEELGEVAVYSYLDLEVNPGDDFGSKTPVFLPDQTARSITVCIDEIVYSDKTVEKLDPQEWKSIPARETVAEMIDDPELIEQVRLDYGDGIDYVPIIENGLFLCSCGAVNLDSNTVCYKCGKSYDSLKKILDKDDLTERLSERLDREAVEREEERKRLEAQKEAARIRKEEQIEKAKSSGKKVAKIAGAVVIAIVLAYIAKVAIVSIMTANKYNQANELCDAGDYAQAIELYYALDDYKDSNDREAVAYANLADQYLEKNDYSNANSSLKFINDYQYVNKEWEKEAISAKETYINTVISLADKGDYENSIRALIDINDTDFYEYLQYCRAERVLQLVKDNKLEDAKVVLTACEETPKYKNEREEAYSSFYNAVIELINDKKYESGSKLMNELGYKDNVKYYKYCNLAMEVSKKFDFVNLSKLYNDIAVLGKDFKMANDLIKDNKYLSEISSLEGTWKAQGSRFYGELGQKYKSNVATIVVKDGTATLTDDSYMSVGGGDNRDTGLIFTVDDGKLVTIPLYDFTEGEDLDYEYDDYKATLKNGVFTFHYHNGDVVFTKE